MKLSYACIAAALTAAISLGSCRSDSGREELAHNHGHDHEAENHDHEAEEPGHSHESAETHEGEIELSPEKGERFGVRVATAEKTPFAEVIVVSGQILPSPSETSVVAAKSAGIVRLAGGIAPGAKVAKGQTVATVSAKGMAGGDANETARVALEAAKRELDRVTPLHAEGIVSTRDYNAARQRYDEARVAAGSGASGAGSAATAVSSGTITKLLVGQGQFVEAGQPIAEISGSGRMTLRADLPEGKASAAANVSGASFRPSYSSETIDLDKLNGRRVAGDPYASASAGYIPLYFDFDSDGSVVSGAFCEVYLRGAGKGDALTVPVSALSEQQGQLFVYVEAHPGAYLKRPVTAGSNDGHRVEILSGLKPGERFVADGVTFVRLAETADVKPEGHTHSH